MALRMELLRADRVGAAAVREPVDAVEEATDGGGGSGA